MPPNPILSKLGFSPSDRVVILHTDDIGMCQASIQAYEDLWQAGTITSGAVMVPCPWFPAAAEMQRRHPGMDLGVHLTLTSEWQHYRWRPLTGRLSDSSLIDAQGFFPRTDPEVQAGGDPEEAAAEMQAQIERALQFGIDVTHIDTHMGAVAHPKFIPAYLQLAGQFRLPPMIPRGDAAVYESLGLDRESASLLAGLLTKLEQDGTPLVDAVAGLPLDQPQGQLELAKSMLSDLPAGLTHFILHPSIDTPELRAITPDWPSRVANYETFMSREFREFIRSSGLHLIGYRELREVIRA
jgi:predicted glycoside hydrolase/deacetylase ChbG (UPF0249 family)